LASPSPPIEDSTAMPGVPAAPVEEPTRPAASGDDRAQGDSDQHPIEKSAAHATAPAPARGSALARAAIESEAVPPSAAASAAIAQPPSLASADTVAGSAAAGSDSASPPPSEPPPHASSPPAKTGLAPVAPDPAATSTPPLADPTSASVAIGNIATTGGISAGKVRIALARLPFISCYRSALATRPSAAPMEASLRLNIDVSGRVAGAALSNDGNLPGLRPCIESGARSLSIRDVDTGDGSAVITLTFSPR
jgi:hypothetical protein